MAFNFRKFLQGIKLIPNASSQVSEKGDIEVLDSSGKLNFHNGTTASPMVTESHSATMTNKTIDGDDNTIQDLALSSLKTNLADADKFIVRDASGIPVSNTKAVPTGAVVGTSDSQTLTNKTIDGDDNTVQDLALTSLKTNLADANKFIVRDASGIPVSNTKAVPSGAVVGTTDAQVITAKDIDGGTATNTNRITLPKDTTTNLNALTRKEATLVYDTTIDTVKADDGSTLIDLVKDGSSPAASGEPVLMDKTNGVLRFKKLVAGTGVTLGVASDAITINASGGGGGSGGESKTGLVNELAAAEADQLQAIPPNTILDDYDDEAKGTKTNVVASNDSLVLTTGNNSGNVEYILPTTLRSNQVDAVMEDDIRELAPKGTTIAANTIKFEGDVSGYFASGKSVMIFKRPTNGNVGVNSVVALLDTDDEPAFLSVSSVSFSAGETSLVLTNPNSLDLSMGLSNTQYNAQLRVKPFNHLVKAKSATASAYETMAVKDITGSGEYVKSGESYISEVMTLTGSELFRYSNRSPSGQYIIQVVAEKTSGDTDIHVGYSKDYGVTWTKFTPALDYGTSSAEDISGVFRRAHDEMIAVNDDGVAVIAYPKYVAGQGYYCINAVYTDLSAGSPTLTDTADNTAAAVGTYFGSGAVLGSTGGNFNCIGVAFASDSGRCYIVGSYETGSTLYSIGYTAGGATLSGPHGSAFITINNTASPDRILVTGASGSCRFHVVYRTNPSGYVSYVHFDEGSWTAVTTIAIDDGVACIPLSHKMDEANNKLHILLEETGGQLFSRYINNVATGTPSASSVMRLHQNEFQSSDLYNGYSNNATFDNKQKTTNSRIVVNPNNADNVLYVNEVTDNDGIVRPVVFEVRDITNFQGPNITQLSGNTDNALRDATARTIRAQTFLTTSNRQRSVTVFARQIGDIPSGYTLQAKIYATSAGAPTGAALHTSVNSFDPQKISKGSNYQAITFTFDTPALTSATTYAISLEADYPVSASNYLNFYASSANPYANGESYSYNGSAWSADAGYDFAFVIHSEFRYDISQDISGKDASSIFKVPVWAQETQCHVNSNDTVTISSKRSPLLTGSATAIPKVGHMFRKVLSFGSAGTSSTLTGWEIMGYSSGNYDENLMFSTSLGSDECAKRNTVTGALTATGKAMDRSGNNADMSSSNEPTVTSDVDFPSGVCYDFNGTANYFSYDGVSDSDLHEVDARFPFEVIAAIKTPSTSGSRVVISKSNGTTGWWFGLDSGYITMNIDNGTVLVKASDATEASSMHYIRCYWDGSVSKLYRSNDGSSWTEVASYSSQDDLTTTSTAHALNIGTLAGGASYWSGKLEAVKFGRAVSPYVGFKNQEALVNTKNHGDISLARASSGENDFGAGVNFNKVMVIDPAANESAVVDTEKLRYFFSHSIAGTSGQDAYLKIEMDRASATDDCGIAGIDAKYTKS